MADGRRFENRKYAKTRPRIKCPVFFYLTGYKPKCQLAFVANINVTLLANLLKQLLVVDMKRVTKLKEDTGFLTVSISMSCCMWKKHLAFWGHDPLGTINPPSLFPFRSFYFPFPSYPLLPSFMAVGQN